MSMKKILCAILVVALVVCGATAIVKNNESSALKAQVTELNAQAGAVTELQAELDAANARIAELEAAAEDAAAAAEEAAAAETAAADEQAAADADLQALVDMYKPYYDAQVIVEYNGGVIMKDEVMDIYALYEQSAAQYGIDLVAYGMDAQYKEMAAQNALEDAVVFKKAAELGLDQLDEETVAGLTEAAKADYENYITTISPNFEGEDVTEEAVREQAVAYLESMGYTEQMLIDGMIDNYVAEQVYNHTTADVAVTDEDVKAAYDELVAEQESSFADDSAYNDARNNGEMIVWNPEGYRAVKQVLIKFSDEQDATYSDLQSTLKTLNSELEAAQAPAEETVEETADEEASEEESAETEETAEVRAVEEIEADIAAVQADIDALYAELHVEAQEVIDKFNAGTPFADLIAEHNDDPGMNNEPTATNGYAVAAASTTWDPTFTAGAMSIESVGGISEPINGSYGVYIIYYESDIPAGAVAYEEVSESLAASTLEAKVSQTYNDAVVVWLADAAPVYHLENLAN